MVLYLKLTFREGIKFEFKDLIHPFIQWCSTKHECIFFLILPYSKIQYLFTAWLVPSLCGRCVGKIRPAVHQQTSSSSMT